MKIVRFKDWDCYLQLGQYSNGRVAIQLTQIETHEPVAVATLNLPGVNLEDNETLVKDYSENEGMLKTLMDAGIVSEPKEWIATGFVEVARCDVNMDALLSRVSGG